MIPAWLVLLGALVVIADAIAVALFILRWERRTAAPRQVTAAAAGVAHRSSAQHSATQDPAIQYPATPEQADPSPPDPSVPQQTDTRAGALSS